MGKKYELTTDIVQVDGHTLYRIRALKDIPRYGVKKGHVGGYIESEENLSHEGDCWIGNHSYVYGNSRVYENGHVFFGPTIKDNVRIYGNGRVYNEVKLHDNVQVYDDSVVHGKNNELYNNVLVCCAGNVSGENNKIYGYSVVTGYIATNNKNIYDKNIVGRYYGE